MLKTNIIAVPNGVYNILNENEWYYRERIMEGSHPYYCTCEVEWCYLKVDCVKNVLFEGTYCSYKH